MQLDNRFRKYIWGYRLRIYWS